MMISHKRNHVWAREIIQDGENYGLLEGTTRQVKRPNPFSSYMALIFDILEKDPVEITKTTKRGGESVVTVLKQF
jgi:hypothetical protein